MTTKAIEIDQAKGTTMKRKVDREYWEARGFTVREGGRVTCDSCAALSINGVACHETGCPNAMHECRGCNALVPVRVKYCEECAS